jgi:diguanylate cyclase (GGDEF)-like protein
VNGRATNRIQAELHQFSDTEDLARTLDNSRQQLEAAMRRNDELLRLRTVLMDKVSSLELELAKTHRLTHYDELTGLPNRRLLLDRFIQASALANRHRQDLTLPHRHRVELALLFFDLNDFKSVNDELGHEAGDKLLQQVATRLSTSIRQSDTACRFGGDEFVVLLTEIDSREHAVTTLQKIRDRLAPTFVVDRHSIRLTVSNGIAIYPEDAQSFTDLLRMSNRLMFSDKSVSKSSAGVAHKSSIWLRDARNELCLSQ